MKDYTILRVWVETHKKLRILAAWHGVTMIRELDRIVDEACREAKPQVKPRGKVSYLRYPPKQEGQS